MSERAPYSRVYWSIVDDPKFGEVYDDDRHLACWLRLLMMADQAWPASAPIPATARKASVKLLLEVGLIDPQPGGRYRVHGLDAERGRRKAAATSRGTDPNPSGDHSGTTPGPNGFGTQGLSRDEPRQDEPSRADAREVPDGRDDLEAFLAVRFRAPTPRQRALLDAYCRAFDQTGPARAARLIWSHPDDPIGAVKADLQAWRTERIAEAKAQETPKPQPKRKGSGLTGVTAELAALFAKQNLEREGAS